MADSLNAIVQPAKQPKESEPNENVPKFSFKKAATATISKPSTEPEVENVPDAPAESALNVTEAPISPELQFQIEPLNKPSDDILLQFLAKFDPVTKNPPQQPLQTMNISNVSNVRNVANQRMIPTIYFGGNSTITINYNFPQSK